MCDAHMVMQDKFRDLSMFSCGGFRVRKEEELERSYGCLGAVWTVSVNSNPRKKEKREREETTKANMPIAQNTQFY